MYRLPCAKLLAAVLSLVAVIASAGCGKLVVVGADRTLGLALSEYRVNPQDVRVRSGSLTLVVHNYGRLTHNLVVSQAGVYDGVTKPIPPGQSTQLTLTLAPGRYDLASTLLSDQALGEYGALTVAP
ncbi:MAG: cupredoxin domain-containing protein [Solirubrobacteraceae bacterium]